MVMFPINPAWGEPLPGGIYAAPTNTRYRVYVSGDQVVAEGLRAVCGPYKPAENGSIF